MGKKGSWFSIVRKALSPDPKEKKEKKPQKPRRRWFGKQKTVDEEILPAETAPAIPHYTSHSPLEDVKLPEANDEQTKRANSVVSATAIATEAAVAAANAAAAEVVRLIKAARYSGKSTEEIAAIKIQTVFRGYLARKAVRTLKGLARLRSLIKGKSVQRQAKTTLRCMQTLARVQSQIRARRIRLSEENQALQRLIQQKREKDIEKLRVSMGENWENSAQSKKQVEANLQYKQEAAMRRERALAYAYSQQQTWKNLSHSTNPTSMDPSSPHWGWSWLERWMAARPWESKSASDKDLNSDRSSVQSTPSRAISVGELSRANSRRDLNLNSKISPSSPKPSRPPSRQSISSIRSNKAPTSPSVAGQTRPWSRRASSCGGDYDSRITLSVKSERQRRHSIAESLVSDDESLASSPAAPSYVANTKLAKSRTRLPSPLGLKNNGTTSEKPAGSAKKRLSFSGSFAGRRRHSISPKMDNGSSKDISLDA